MLNFEYLMCDCYYDLWQVVFNSVMRWVRYDLEGRRHHLPELLRGIRLALLPSECLLEAVACEELVMADKRSR